MLKKSFIWFTMANITSISCFFKFCTLPLFVVNDPHALYVKTGCFLCIFGINASPSNQNLLFVSFFFYYICINIIYHKVLKHYLKEFFSPRLLNNPLASCFLIHLFFFLKCYIHYNKLKPLFSH